MHDTLEDEVQRIVASMDEQHNGQEQDKPETTEQETQPEETIHIHYFPDAIVILKEEDKAQVVDSTPVIPQKISFVPAYAIGFLYFLLILSTLAFQVYVLLNPPIATVTIIPKSQQIHLTGTLQFGRLLSPITLSQAGVTKTTGKGHQDARSARGTVTFYNGSFAGQTIPAGTVLTGADSVQIITDQYAILPPESQTIPPTLGQTTVSAHALVPGRHGNIPTGDINQGCCAPSILVQNTAPFYNGQNERDFQTVTKSDIDTTAQPLKTTLTQNMQETLQGQHKQGEALQILPPCIPQVSTSHQIGQETPFVKVTVSMSCSGVAYNTQEHTNKVTQLLTNQALRKLGTGYSLFGSVQVSVQPPVTPTNKKIAVVSYQAFGTWVYGLTTKEQQMKQLITGHTKQAALRLLQSLPGIERASIQWGDDTKLPKIPSIFMLSLFLVLDETRSECIIQVYMSNYHLTPISLPSLAAREAREKRRKVLEAVRERRKTIYTNFYKKMRLQANSEMIY